MGESPNSPPEQEHITQAYSTSSAQAVEPGCLRRPAQSVPPSPDYADRTRTRTIERWLQSFLLFSFSFLQNPTVFLFCPFFLFSPKKQKSGRSKSHRSPEQLNFSLLIVNPLRVYRVLAVPKSRRSLAQSNCKRLMGKPLRVPRVLAI